MEGKSADAPTADFSLSFSVLSSNSRMAGFLMVKVVSRHLGGDPSQPFLPFLSSLICCLCLCCGSTRAWPCRLLTYCPAGIHCSQLDRRHVFDSTRTCVRTNQLAHFCKRACVSLLKCLQIFFWHVFTIGGNIYIYIYTHTGIYNNIKRKKMPVRTSLIIKNNPSICSAGFGAGSAEKHGKKKMPKQEKKVMWFLQGGREKSVFTIPLLGLANFLLAVGSTEMRAC